MCLSAIILTVKALILHDVIAIQHSTIFIESGMSLKKGTGRQMEKKKHIRKRQKAGILRKREISAMIWIEIS